MSEQWLSIAEAAKQLGRPKPTIANWVKRKVVKSRKDLKPNGMPRLMVELELLLHHQHQSFV